MIGIKMFATSAFSMSRGLNTIKHSNCCCNLKILKLLTAVKLYSSALKPETRRYVRKDQNYKIGKKYAVETLETLFNIRRFKALSIASKYKSLCEVPSDTLSTNYHICKENGIRDKILLEYPEILSKSELEVKIRELKLIGLDIKETVPLLKLDMHKLKRFTENTEDNCVERLKFLSEMLEKPIRTICEYSTEKTFLLTMDLDKLEQKIHALTEFGIAKEDVLNDLWVLRYNDDVIRNKLQEARESNVDTIKTWMVRAPSRILDIYIRRRSDNKLILGNHSIAEYLSQRLDCSVENAKYLMSKHPALENKSLKKVQEIIDFLYSYGFKPYHICRVPKILLHSVETTKRRLKMLRDEGHELDSLHILTKSQKQYMQYYDGIVKINKKHKNKK